MKYDKIVRGEFIQRNNRFVAEVIIDGKKETVHVRNTGRCKELLIPGAKLLLEDCQHNKTRKTRYSLVSVWKGDILVNMDSQIPNDVVYKALMENRIKGLEDLDYIKREFTYGDSRFDIYFEDGEERGFIEVKGVTLEEDNLAMFPDAPTIRGTKHVLEMIRAVKEGYRGIIFFLVQMKGPNLFKPNWAMDKNFAEAIKGAQEKGVEIMVYDSIVGEDSISLGDPIPFQIE